MGRALLSSGLTSGRVLVRGIAGPAEEVSGHEDGDHEHHGREDDFTMHFCSHTPGSMAGSGVKPARHAFLQSVLL
jgi:hypothetical protein